MNCAKCSRPGRQLTGRPPRQFRLGVEVRLLKVGEVGDCDKYQCPLCRAIFFFTKRRVIECASV